MESFGTWMVLREEATLLDNAMTAVLGHGTDYPDGSMFILVGLRNDEWYVGVNFEATVGPYESEAEYLGEVLFRTDMMDEISTFTSEGERSIFTTSASTLMFSPPHSDEIIEGLMGATEMAMRTTGSDGEHVNFNIVMNESHFLSAMQAMMVFVTADLMRLLEENPPLSRDVEVDAEASAAEGVGAAAGEKE